MRVRDAGSDSTANFIERTLLKAYRNTRIAPAESGVDPSIRKCRPTPHSLRPIVSGDTRFIASAIATYNWTFDREIKNCKIANAAQNRTCNRVLVEEHCKNYAQLKI